jgi:ATP-binding cassette subfamily F protein 3
VRDGRVVNYRGDYEAYLYSINQEIDANEINAAEQQQPARRAAAQSEKRSKAPNRDTLSNRDIRRDQRSVRKEVAALEKTISRLEGQKVSTDQQLLAATDPAEAVRLHQELVSLKGELDAAEERWFRLQD